MLIYTDRSMCRYQSYYPSHYQYTNKREMFPPVREEEVGMARVYTRDVHSQSYLQNY